MNAFRGPVRTFTIPLYRFTSSLLLLTLLFAAKSRTFAQGVSPFRDSPQAHSQLPLQISNGSARLLGHFTATPRLRLTLALRPPHLAEEEKFLAELADKKSPNFHRFLTADQWNARFAPSASDEQAVVDWATSNGFTVAQRFPNRLLVDLEAPVSTIESAFGVTINNYAIGTEVDFSNDREPVLPAAIAPLLVSVQGLNNIQRMRAMHVGANEPRGADYQAGPVHQTGVTLHRDGDASKAKPSPATNAVRPDVTNGAYDPADIWSSEAYNYAALQKLGHCCNPTHDSGGSPAASSIAIAAFQDYTSSDLLGFASQYGLALDVDRFYIDGNPGCCGNEVTADVEFSAAMANSFGSYIDTAHIFVYEGGNGNNSTFTDMYNQMLTDGKARVFTTSWSCTEFAGCDGGTMDARHNIFNQMIGQGWTLMAASGDRGATDNCTNSIDVAYPGSDPNFISVGGTTLQAAGSYGSETAWQGGSGAGSCSGNNGGSGGGCSAKFAAPGYQSSPLCGSGSRSVPDISLNSSINENFFYNGTLQGFAGTSMASPELAGFFAQNNAYLLAIGTGCGSGYGSVCAPVGNGNYYLYQEGNNPNYAPHYPFYDITSGCNSNDVTAFYNLNAFCAGTGYDAVTGWGSANMLQLAWAVGTYLAWDGGAPAMNFSGPPTSGWTNQSGTNVVFNVYDTSNYGYPATGLAGYTAQWDADPGDPRSESTPGSGNPFYNGPAVVTSGGAGSLQVASLSQGCHTAYVRGWDNTGISGLGTYGQVCLDTVAPDLNDVNYPAPNPYGWNNSPVTVSLLATDSGAGYGYGSGVATIFYGYDNVCTPSSTAGCSVYTGSFRVTPQGHHTLYSFARDNAGNNSAEHITFPSVDETAPVTTLALSGTGGGSAFTSAVRLTFSAADSASGTQSTLYSLDGGAATSYTGYLVVAIPGRHSITFHSQDHAGNVEVSKSASFSITSPTTTVLASSLNPSNHGQAVTLAATVKPALSSTPTGNVVFKYGSTVLGTEPISGGRATLTLSTLPVGKDALSATYSGSTYEGASTGSLAETVRTTTATTLATSLASASFGQSFVLTATVRPGASTTPTGPVQFLTGSTVLGTGSVSGGKATLTVSNLAISSHSLVAKYEGDTLDLASTSAAITEVITPAKTTTILTSTRNPSIWGEALTFTAVVKSGYTGTPTGTVTFRSGSTVLATTTLSAGKATFSTATLAPGKPAITATYNGSADFALSLSATLTETVLQAPTKVALVASPSSAAFKQVVRLSATVNTSTAVTATGTVTFKDGTTVLGSANLNSGAAVFNIATLAAGTHSISAVSNGSADDTVGTSAPISVKISAAASSTTLTSTPNPVVSGQAVTFTIRVVSAAGTPIGTVHLNEDGKLLATLTLKNGVAIYSTKTLTTGTHSLQAIFVAAGDFAASSSTALKQIVK